VSTGFGDDLWRVYHPGIYPGYSGPLSLAIPLLVGAVSNGGGIGQRWGKNGELCVAVGPATRTAIILARGVLP